MVKMIRKMAKTVIIYIDIDDDLSLAGIKSPVIGEANVKEAIDKASEIMADDSDFNSMIVAYNIYKKMKKEGQDVEIVFLAGSQKGGLEAQRKISAQLDEIIKELNPQDSIVVYDSPEDAKALPIIQSRLKISGVQRVIVEQHRGVEETYILLGKYFKKILNEPRYSRIFLGVPGAILFAAGILEVLGLISYIVPVITILIGSAMIIRGFDLDEMMEKWWENSTIMVIAALLSSISFAISLINGYFTYISIKGNSVYVISTVISSMLPYITFSILILLGAKALSSALDKSIKLFHDIIKISAIIISYYIITDVLKNLEEGIYIIQFQSFYALTISSMVLIFAYIILNLIEKYKFSSS